MEIIIEGYKDYIVLLWKAEWFRNDMVIFCGITENLARDIINCRDVKKNDGQNLVWNQISHNDEKSVQYHGSILIRSIARQTDIIPDTRLR